MRFVVQKADGKYIYAVVTMDGRSWATWWHERDKAMKFLSESEASLYAAMFGGITVPFMRRRKKVENL